MTSSLLRLALYICSFLIVIITSLQQEGPSIAVVTVAALASSTSGGSSKRRVKPLPRQDPYSVEAALLQPRQRQNPKQRRQQYRYILGSDESGVGCIAGPIVCVSCCVLNATRMIRDCPISVRDGKMLSKDDCDDIRRYVDKEMTKMKNIDDATIRYVVTTRSNHDIDQHGIYQCVQDGFRESIQRLVDELLSLDGHGNDESDDDRNNLDTANIDHRNTLEREKTTTTTMIHSIVDGQRSPSFADFTSRPWPQADATVYTVAVAGCLARSIHGQIMAEYQEQNRASLSLSSSSSSGNGDDTYTNNSSSSSFFRADSWDGGYPTPAHLQALATHGPTGWHRQSCKPVQQFTDRRSTLSLLTTMMMIPPTLLTTGTTIEPANAMIRERDMLLPEAGEIAAAVPTDWSEIDTIEEPLGRLDDNDDAIFYQEGRFVEHIDETSVGALRTYLKTIVVDDPTSSTTKSVLDIGASWTSHLHEQSSSVTTTTDNDNNNKRRRIVGIGMNAKELAANEVLSERIVQNLNRQTTLPLPDNTFDIVLCQLTIDYLTRPVTVCKELRRVLKREETNYSPGTIHIVFSNRLFLQKAVDNWTGHDDLDHVETVASYLHYAGFRNIEAEDLSIRNKRGSIVGDPLYVVRAVA